MVSAPYQEYRASWVAKLGKACPGWSPEKQQKKLHACGNAGPRVAWRSRASAAAALGIRPELPWSVIRALTLAGSNFIPVKE